jgi:UDP-2-acetamido-2-deoxy-ribo-hexuluronate aminotransferase
VLQDVARVPVIGAGNTHVYAQYTIEVDNREAVQKPCRAGRAHRRALPDSAAPATGLCPSGPGRGSFPLAEAAGKRVMSLPMHPSWMKPPRMPSSLR